MSPPLLRILFLVCVPFLVCGQTTEGCARPDSLRIPRPYVANQALLIFSDVPTIKDVEPVIAPFEGTVLELEPNGIAVLVDYDESRFGPPCGLVLGDTRGRLRVIHDGGIPNVFTDDYSRQIDLESDVIGCGYIAESGPLTLLDLNGPNGISIAGEVGRDTVCVAVLDSGVDPINHEQLFGVSTGKVEEGEDLLGHGTAVAGVVASVFADGLRDRLQLREYVVLEDDGRSTAFGLLTELKQALEDRNDIIHMSVGFYVGRCERQDAIALWSEYLQLQREAIVDRQPSLTRNPLIVCSAGNEGVLLDDNPRFPACDTGPLTITVGALNEELTSRASFSNYSPTFVDMLAPGEMIAVPLVSENCYLSVDGTSFAAPIVTGVLARLLSRLEIGPALATLRSYTEQRESVAGYSALGVLNTDVGNTLQGGADTGPDEVLPVDLDEVEIFPNPFDEFLQLSVPAYLVGSRYAVYDIVGRPVLSGEIRITDPFIGTCGLGSGTYFLRLTYAGRERVFPLIKR